MNVQIRTGNEAPLVAYNYGMHESLVVQMYGYMLKDGDLERIFDRTWTLTDFLHFFKMEVALVFQDDKDGIWFAAWLRETRARVVELAIWVRKDHRKSINAPKALLAWETVCGRALKSYSTILGLSRPNLVSIHNRLGYRHVGPLDDGVEIFTLTAETFKPRLYREM